MFEWHSLKEEEVYKELKTSENGISSTEAKNRLEKYGKNEIAENKKVNPIILFLKQFKSSLVYILIFAAIISYLFDHIVDMYVILAVIIINASIGFILENKAENSIAALKKMVVSYAKVYRDNELTKIPASQLVPGDVIVLEEGDRIPSDARLIEVKHLRTSEASLTGESFPVDKFTKVQPKNTSLADRRNMIFMGTYIAYGSCKAVVVSTGNETAIGTIAKDIQKIPHERSHFHKKTDYLAKQLGILAIASAVLIFFIGYFIKGISFYDIFLFTLASLVSVIPEGLPAVLAIVLAIGSYRMAKKNAIIRRLTSTETLGVVTTIITDKTGTLTKNTMNVERIYLSGYKEIQVSGEGWNPKGEFIQDNKTIVPLENEQLHKMLNISSVCNNSHVLTEGNKYNIVGDPTEAALVVLSQKAGLNKEVLINDRIDDLPFNPELKYRASLTTLPNLKNRKQLYVVGAPEALINQASHLLHRNTKRALSGKYIKEIQDEIDSMTAKGMRVIALAYKDANIKEISPSIIKDLIFVGIVGIRDPPRPEVKEAVRKANEAGIRVVMATGDHKLTAMAIAKEIGLNSDSAFTGAELEELSDRQLRDTIRTSSIFARLTPSMKLKIASILQEQGEIVAMTGDGVNDAPALKKADIGISMGQIGTDVARESSDIVLADDNFASIVNAIEEGRIVFTNTRQTSAFFITTNLSEALVILITLAINLPLPFLPAQILWLNLVTGGGTNACLATEKSHSNVLKEKPRKADENFISKKMTPFVFLISLTMILSTLVLFSLYLSESLEKARTMAFAVMTLAQLFNVYNMRSLEKSIFKVGFFSNKWVNIAIPISLALYLMVLYIPFFMGIFSFVALDLMETFLVVIFASFVLWIGEGYKWLTKK